MSDPTVRADASELSQAPDAPVVAACYRRTTPGPAALLDVRAGSAMARRLGPRRLARLGRFGPVRRRPVSEVLHWDRW